MAKISLRSFSLLSVSLSLALLASAATTSKSAPAPNPATLEGTITSLNQMSNAYNATPKDPKRMKNFLDSMEKFLERKLSSDERGFISAELARLDKMPLVAMNKDKLLLYTDAGKNSKVTLMTIEVVDVKKSLFKFGNKVYELKADKPLPETLQIILNGMKESQNSQASG